MARFSGISEALSGVREGVRFIVTAFVVLAACSSEKPSSVPAPRSASSSSIAPPAISRHSPTCTLYGSPPTDLVLTMGVDGPVWGARELWIHRDGNATYAASSHALAGLNFPRTEECHGRVPLAEIVPARDALKPLCERAPMDRGDAWIATVCIDGCTVRIGDADPEAASLLRALERLAQRVCAG